MTFSKWLITFLTEKNLLETVKQSVWTIEDDFGQLNIVEGKFLVDQIFSCPAHEQASIKKMLVKIDFYHAPVMPFFEHLANAFVQMNAQQLA